MLKRIQYAIKSNTSTLLKYHHTTIRHHTIVGIDVGTLNCRLALLNPPTLITSQQTSLHDSLTELNERVGKVLQEPTREPIHAVLSVPQGENRLTIKNEGELAGFRVDRIISHPVAAILGTSDWIRKEGIVAVVDVGASFKVSIMGIECGICELLSSYRDDNLGGKWFDKCIVDWMVQKGVHADKDVLIQMAERARIELSVFPTVTIPCEPPIELSRDEFENMSQWGVKQMMDVLQKEKVERVIMVGGLASTPMLQKMVKQVFEGKEFHVSEAPEGVVAFGTFIQAASLCA